MSVIMLRLAAALAVALFLPPLQLAAQLQIPAAQEVSPDPGFRKYRAINHIVLALQPLEAGEAWTGMTYTENDKKYKGVSWGNSCLISPDGHLLTNHHIVANAILILVGGWSDTDKLVRAEILKKDEKNDLALLKIDPPDKIVAWISRFSSTETLYEGEEVFLWAYLQIPGGFVPFLRRASVSMSNLLPPFENLLYIETSASFGTSGTPVITKQDGHLVGVVSSAITLPGGRALPAGIMGAIPGQVIMDFLKSSEIQGYRK